MPREFQPGNGRYQVDDVLMKETKEDFQFYTFRIKRNDDQSTRATRTERGYVVQEHADLWQRFWEGAGEPEFRSGGWFVHFDLLGCFRSRQFKLNNC